MDVEPGLATSRSPCSRRRRSSAGTSSPPGSRSAPSIVLTATTRAPASCIAFAVPAPALPKPSIAIAAPSTGRPRRSSTARAPPRIPRPTARSSMCMPLEALRPERRRAVRVAVREVVRVGAHVGPREEALDLGDPREVGGEDRGAVAAGEADPRLRARVRDSRPRASRSSRARGGRPRRS